VWCLIGLAVGLTIDGEYMDISSRSVLNVSALERMLSIALRSICINTIVLPHSPDENGPFSSVSFLQYIYRNP
jgi:hypothetical protein